MLESANFWNKIETNKIINSFSLFSHFEIFLLKISKSYIWFQVFEIVCSSRPFWIYRLSHVRYRSPSSFVKKNLCQRESCHQFYTLVTKKYKNTFWLLCSYDLGFFSLNEIGARWITPHHVTSLWFISTCSLNSNNTLIWQLNNIYGPILGFEYDKKEWA